MKFKKTKKNNQGKLSKFLEKNNLPKDIEVQVCGDDVEIIIPDTWNQQDKTKLEQELTSRGYAKL